jgi:hypothetical protein
METQKKLKSAVIGLSIVTIFLLGALAWLMWRNYSWRNEADDLARRAGSQLAVTCILLNQPIVYEWNPDDRGCVDAGRKDGQFEVWYWPDDPDATMQSEHGQHKMMEAFNSTMRETYNDPRKLRSWRDLLKSSSTNATPDATTNKPTK